MQGIYAIIHTDTNRWYIGSSINLTRRFKEHKWRFNSRTHPARHLASAFLKYGQAAFQFVILESYDSLCESDLIERENAWIDFIKPVFNVAPVAGSVAGLKRSAEVRAKMSEAQRKRYAEKGNPTKGRPRTAETKAAISAGHKGRQKSPEHLANLSAALKGRTSPNKGKSMSQETKDKISCAQTGKVVSSETRKKQSDAMKARWLLVRERKTPPDGQ